MKHPLFFKAIILGFLLFTAAGLSAQSKDKNPPEEKRIKPALLVIDIQNEYLKYMSEDDKSLGMTWINSAIWAFHQYKLPVIRVYHTDPIYGPKPGTEPFEFPKSVIISEDDPKVIKNYPSAFVKTDLDKILKEKGCNTLFLCGLSSVGCVLATYYGGQERDYKVFMIRDAIMSHNSAYTDVVEDFCETITLDTLAFLLEHLR